MFTQRQTGNGFARKLTLALGAAAGITLITGGAFAGECPAGKTVADGMGQKMGATMPKDVTDVVIASIDVAKAPAAIKDRLFRLRRLEIKPGGVVPWHSHGDRPAIIYVVTGEVTEYASTCAVPIVHRAGEATPEMHTTSHWWKNTGKSTVVLLSADLLHDKAEEHMM
jgi:quercetin dioxygenase-like cupin family protein